jgi:hypothetical protein
VCKLKLFCGTAIAWMKHLFIIVLHKPTGYCKTILDTSNVFYCMSFLEICNRSSLYGKEAFPPHQGSNIVTMCGLRSMERLSAEAFPPNQGNTFNFRTQVLSLHRHMGLRTAIML